MDFFHVIARCSMQAEPFILWLQPLIVGCALRRSRASKGQILIILVLILIGLIVVLGILSLVMVRRPTPTVRETFWTVADSRVSTAKRGQEVEAHVVVRVSEEYVGSIVVKIRKDVALWVDSDYHISTVPTNIKGGDEKEIMVAFTPDEASGGSLRGYFVEIEFRATRTSWTMENSYPPRLKVTD